MGLPAVRKQKGDFLCLTSNATKDGSWGNAIPGDTKTVTIYLSSLTVKPVDEKVGVTFVFSTYCKLV